jgi:hypothetical protein
MFRRIEIGELKTAPSNYRWGVGLDFWTGVSLLDWLLKPVNPRLWITSHMTLDYYWGFPSLISSLAMMVVQDMVEQRRIRFCEACGVLFLSSAPQARYCSTRCRNTAEKRRLRARRKADSGDQGAAQ